MKVYEEDVTAAIVRTKKAAAIFYRERIVKLYEELSAEHGKCAFCSRDVWWLPVKDKQRTPYTMDGQNHYVECPPREED
jgi:hypothetical protein